MARKDTRFASASEPRRGRARWPRLVLIYTIVAAAMLGGGGLVAAHLEDDNAFCASCHTQPETTFFARTQAQLPVDLASAHATERVTCIACHSGAGVSGRVAAMSLGAHDLGAYLINDYHSPAAPTVRIDDANCLKCHGDLPAKAGFNNHFHRFLAQWQKLDAHAATCVDCHSAHATGGDSREAFLLRAPTVAVCQRCHNFAG